MRPNRLEVSGFTAFREPVTVDFRGADLFALTGPTGSGKSSLIDAIVFSLYGSVPRIGQRDVAPIVSLGKLEARVRFDFSLDGTDYTVARVVRRTNGGASTAEARLERGKEVLAGTADDVTERIGRLLGLGYEHFTKSVVLPQGQFAAFLHDRPAERQKLLRELLDLGVYERMRELAKQRRVAAEARLGVLRTQIDEMAFATSEAEGVAEERLARLQAVHTEVEEAGPQLEELRDRVDSASKAATGAQKSADQLRGIVTPEGMEELATRLTESRAEAEEADSAAAEVAKRLEAAEEARKELPTGVEIDRVIERHRALLTEHKSLAGVTDRLSGLAGEAKTAADSLEAASNAAKIARAELETVNRDHAAHALAAALVVGEDCPVCRQTVQTLRPGSTPPALAEAEATLIEATQAEKDARETEAAGAKRMATEEARLADLTDRITHLQAELADAPNLDDALEARKAITRAESGLAELRGEGRRVAEAAQSARKRIETVESEAVQARRHFDEVRDRVAALQPPVPGRTDLAGDWTQLTTWAIEAADRLIEESQTAEASVKELGTRFNEKEQALGRLVEEAGIEIGDLPIRDAVVAATTAAAHELERIKDGVERIAKLETEVVTNTEEAGLAKALGRHLSATGFEAWLMEEALTTLVEGANLLLDDLADGAYSLELVRRDFRVIDHRNANEARLVKTLSGGETFLVSLALALSLAEQLASMSVHGGGRLESVFLDEGFGTLDVETLDTVAHVIQELGARGRTVGIVTHVRDLAEQVPVRFEVRKSAGTATVHRVEL